MTFNKLVKEEIEELKIDEKYKYKNEEQVEKNVIREIFYKHGFLNEPSKRHHLEIIFKEEERAKEVQLSLEQKTINSKITMKNKNYILYIKDGEEISKFLAYIGTRKAVLKFEEERVLKDTKNNINRLINCENANMDKTIKASVEQIRAIDYLVEQNKFETLPEGLKEIALLRKQEPELSLIELGNMLGNKISKAGVNHRLKKIMKIAEDLKKE